MISKIFSEIWGNIGLVVPFVVFLFTLVSLFLDKKLGSVKVMPIYIGIMMFLILGFDWVIFLTLFLGFYSLGYFYNRFIFGTRIFSIINVALGISLFYIPIFLLSILSYFLKSYPALSDKYSTDYLAILFWSVMLLSIVLFLATNREFFGYPLKLVKNYSNSIDVSTYSLLALFFCILGYVNAPLINYDDLATHYYIQNQFLSGNFPSFDVSSHVWAVSQWILDIYYGIVESSSMFRGRSILNFVFGLTLFILCLEVLSKRFTLNVSLLITLVCFSSPLFVLSLTTSQTELFTALLALSVIQVLLSSNGGSFYSLFPLLAFSVAIKPSNAVIFLPVLLFAASYEVRNGFLRNYLNLKFGLVFSFSLFIAFSMYGFAYYVTYNPFFPLFNSIFQAEHFPKSDFFNSLYTNNFEISALWELFFNTSKYLESSNYVVGVQVLFLPLMFLFVFLNSSYKREKIIFLSYLIGGVAIFHSQQYARYIMPTLFILPLLFILFINDFFKHVLKKNIILLVFVFTVFVNVSSIPNVIWYLNGWENSPLSIMVSNRNAYGRELEKIHDVNNYLNQLPGHVKVVYPYDKPYAAGLEDDFLYINWYDYSASKNIIDDSSRINDLFLSEGATHIIVSSLDNRQNEILALYAKSHGILVYQNLMYDVYKLNFSDYSLGVMKDIVIGNPRVSDESILVDPENFVVKEYDGLRNVSKVLLSMEMSCEKPSVWKDYVEFDRYTDFTNFFRTKRCSLGDEFYVHETEIIVPFGSKQIRIFVQPLEGSIHVRNVKLQRLN
ncbi:hypothetical protein [Vibrio nigripulchritudo]|uniref:hypothetical protein n=1 Tax=Vibrio nigripulchritudo TaxID=28173 RepID=UPI0003B2402E|nr:hypothetical protein [Vibrio nigripulchritudo]CCN70293.1 conserved membrane hypothetical protein [Vibrio nigripulchritudo SFn118]